jgi:hypothetical protein
VITGFQRILSWAVIRMPAAVTSMLIVWATWLQLAGGQLVQVRHNLIKRQKQHFVALEVRLWAACSSGWSIGASPWQSRSATNLIIVL